MTEPAPLRLPRWARLLEAAVVFGTVVWVAWVLVEQLRALSAEDLRPSLPLLALSLLGGLAVVAAFHGGLLWLDFRAVGHTLDAPTALVLANVPRMGKYLPGRFQAALGLVWLARRLANVPAAKGALVSLLLLAQGVAAVLLAVAPLLVWVVLPVGWRLALVLALGVALVCLHPALFEWPLNVVLRRLGLERLTLRLAWHHHLLIVAAAAALNLAKAFLFVLCAHGLLDLPAGVAAHVAASFLLSALAGFLAFFAPGGIGVQEGAMLLLLAPALPPEQAAVITLAARAWSTLLDLLLGMSNLGWLRTRS
ncbi:MAG: DUF4175 domain-containing protein [Myxococcales bacterium]|nr:DUF4175 domain-containing protein [Myxococcales bacterium]